MTPLKLLLTVLAVLIVWVLAIAFGSLVVDFLISRIFFVLGFSAGIALYVVWR